MKRLALAVAGGRRPASALRRPTMPRRRAKNDYSIASNWLCLPGHEDACSANEDATVVAAERHTESGEIPRRQEGAGRLLLCLSDRVARSRRQQRHAARPRGDGRDRAAVRTLRQRLHDLRAALSPVHADGARRAHDGQADGDAGRSAARLSRRRRCLELLSRALQSRPRRRPDRTQPGLGRADRADQERDRRQADPEAARRSRSSAARGCRFRPARMSAAISSMSRSVIRPATSGCVIAFASFRASVPPPANSRFGKSERPGLEAACVNPAALGGGSGAVHAYLGIEPAARRRRAVEPKPWATGKTVADAVRQPARHADGANARTTMSAPISRSPCTAIRPTRASTTSPATL